MKNQFSEAYQTVVANLSALSKSELRAVFSILRKLDSSLDKKEATRATKELYRWTPLAYSVLANETRLHKNTAPEQVHYLPKPLLRKVEDLSKELEIDLTELVRGGAITHDCRVNWYRLYARLVSWYLTGRKVPVTIKTLVQNYDKFSSLLDQAYPGYAKSGLLVDMVLRGRVS